MLAEAGVDWQFGVLLLFLVGVFSALLAPVPEREKRRTPSEDTTKIRRLP